MKPISAEKGTTHEEGIRTGFDLGEPAPEVVLPPAPPGESSPEAVKKARAVTEALTRLGEGVTPGELARFIKDKLDLDLPPEEIAVIQRQIMERVQVPPELDQPPPEDARRRLGPVRE